MATTKSVYQVDSYLDTYDGKFLPGSTVGGASLLGRRSILAHSVHCQDGELARMAETASSISHCPVSQQFLATVGGARALDMEDRIGNLDVGREADFLVVDPRAWPPLAGSVDHGARSEDPELARDQTLFGLLLTMREPVITEVYVQGRRIDGA